MAKNSANSTRISQMEALGFVWEIFATIAIPNTACALIGRWADTRFGTNPWLTLFGLLLALGISGALVVRRAQQFAKRMKTPT